MASKLRSPLQPPEAATEAAIERTLGRWRVRRLAQTDSTNCALKALAQGGAPAWQCLYADEQTAGRGQYGRAWHSPPGVGLYCSLLLRPALTPDELHHVTTFAGLIVCRALAELVGDAARLSVKPPNDVFLDGRKVAGILVEADWRQGKLAFLIVGIGVNIGQTSFPDGLRHPATSLRLALGDAAPTRDIVLQRILEAFAAKWDEFASAPAQLAKLAEKV
ncbi:MAG: biotin--[acetyl-CoA-carboxylase] ligase [Chloracidobacterium sp. CP2_5A]|nr:MAG: biotin--[acetyl-CoA-carboxylase] ligase [Chloracidobacterium sp. CP2_5A]